MTQGKTKLPIRIEGEIAYVPLTKGYEAVIDAADVPLVEGYNWHADVRSHTVYAMRTDYSGEKKKNFYMHRIIMGEPEGLEVDHEDCNGLNNRRKNMRAATRMQNKHNERIKSNNQSGFKGVGFHKRQGRWRARIMINGQRKWLGYYDTPEKAHASYVKASEALHGEFGRVE